MNDNDAQHDREAASRWKSNTRNPKDWQGQESGESIQQVNILSADVGKSRVQGQDQSRPMHNPQSKHFSQS